MNSKTIAIGDLKVGMFLLAFHDANQKIAVKKPGRVPSQQVIDKLINDGIIEVTVDFDRSTFTTKIEPASWKRDKAKLVAFDNEITRAHRLLKESKATVNKMLENVFAEQEVDLEPINEAADDIVESLSNNSDALHSLSALRTKDAYLAEHSLNVGVLLATFGKYLGWPRADLAQLIVGGIVHDIGKTRVDLEILNKPSRLEPEEFEHMKLHQVYSKSLLNSIENLTQMSREVSTMHHEKLDGNGYPLGLKGEQISEVGRMSSIVDIYDALTASRCYKKAMSPAAALKIMMGLSGHHLDSELLKAFILCIGFYPVGSLVELSNNLLGLVWESNEEDMKKPLVKTFYNTQYNKYYEVKMINLATSNLTIKRGVNPFEYNIDIDAYRHQGTS